MHVPTVLPIKTRNSLDLELNFLLKFYVFRDYQCLLKILSNHQFRKFLFYFQTLKVCDENFSLKFYGLTADCPAMSKALKFVGHNAYECCWFCYLHGQHKGNKRQYEYQAILDIRTPRHYLQESIIAQSCDARVSGHLGKSIFQELFDIQLPDSIVMDYLHVTLLGHVKTLTINLYKSFSTIQRQLIDATLRRQSVPHYFKRAIKPLSELCYYKGTEFKNLLFYFLLPICHPILSLEKSAHLALFICSIRLFHGEAYLGTQTGHMANLLFTKFYEDHGNFYSNLQNFVLHLHAHFSMLYENHGALSNIGCFGQEDLIGHISSNRHGTNFFGDLITYYYNVDYHLHKNIHRIKPIDGPFDPVVQSGVFNEEMNRFHSLVCNTCSSSKNCLNIYRRCTIKEHVFHSLIYKKSKKCISYFVQYLTDHGIDQYHFGVIKLFFTCRSESYAVIQNFPTIHAYSMLYKDSIYFDLLDKTLNYFFFVLEKTCRQELVVRTQNIVKHCIVIKTNDRLIVTPISAYDERD